MGLKNSRPAWYNTPMEELVLLVERALAALPKERALMPMVSGGADSVALLLCCLSAAKKTGRRVCAFHAEHGLRGQDSLEDAAFVAALCERSGIPLVSVSLSLDKSSTGAETRAREARYREAVQAAKERSAALLTAHHLDDQAETVLLSLLRGGGTRGLGGMRAVSELGGVPLLRPFLTVPKARLIALLGSVGQDYRTDESNFVPDCARNQLRLSVLPALQALNPRACAHIAQAAECLQTDEACLTALADAAYAKARAGDYPALLFSKLSPLTEAVRRRTLRKLYERYGDASEALSHGDTLALSKLIDQAPGTKINLPCGLRAARGRETIYLERQDGQPLYTPPLPKLKRETGGAVADGKAALSLPARLYEGAVLRPTRAGDVFRPFGMAGRKSVQKALSDLKIDKPFRENFPVLARGDTVYWLAGLSASEETRLSPKEEQATLRVTRKLPWIKRKSEG